MRENARRQVGATAHWQTLRRFTISLLSDTAAAARVLS